MCKYLQPAALFLLAATSHAAPAKPRASSAMLPIPAPRLPSPNGYDLLMQAGKSIQPGGAGSPSASEKLSPAEDLKRQRAYTDKNARALSLMKQALRLPIVSPPTRSGDIGFPNYARLRELARLGVQQSRVLYADKKLDSAVQTALDVVQMSAETQNGALIIGMLVSSAVQGVGRQDLWKWLKECDAATALRAVRRLEAIEARTPPYAAALQEEKWLGLSQLQDTLASPDWKKFRRGDNKVMASTLKNPRDIARLRRFSDLQIQRNLVRAMDRLIAQARLGYSRTLPSITPAADPLSATSIFDKQLQLSTRAHYERARATNRLLMTAFALQSFVMERSQYPRALSELRPKYLQATPLDSFAPGRALRYKRSGDGFTLYSVGPDGVDNGGAPIKGRGIGAQSRGDMVVGFFG